MRQFIRMTSPIQPVDSLLLEWMAETGKSLCFLRIQILFTSLLSIWGNIFSNLVSSFSSGGHCRVLVVKVQLVVFGLTRLAQVQVSLSPGVISHYGSIRHTIWHIYFSTFTLVASGIWSCHFPFPTTCVVPTGCCWLWKHLVHRSHYANSTW